MRFLLTSFYSKNDLMQSVTSHQNRYNQICYINPIVFFVFQYKMDLETLSTFLFFEEVIFTFYKEVSHKI